MLAAGLMPIYATAAMTTTDRISRGEMMPQVEVSSGYYKTIPLKSWPVDVKSFIVQHKAASSSTLKAEATDKATVFRPIAVCRLIDTRGFPAFITVPGPLLPGSNTNVNTNGACGIPTSGVAGLSVAVSILNMTPNSGGFVSLLQQGTPVNGVTAVLNVGAQWTATTSNISILDDSGNFFIHVDQAKIQLVVDVNGYFEDLDNVNVGAQELDIEGTVDNGDVFEVLNTGTGSALSGTNFGTGPGIRVNAGSFAVSGADIGSGTTAFIVEVGASAVACQSISHPMLDNDSSALVMVTPREGTPTSVGGTAPATIPVAAAYGTCAANHWGIRGITGNLPARSQYSVFIIKSQ